MAHKAEPDHLPRSIKDAFAVLEQTCITLHLVPRFSILRRLQYHSISTNVFALLTHL